MEHEFVPGKRRCQGCGLKWNKWNTEPCFGAAGRSEVPFDVPPPEPELLDLDGLPFCLSGYAQRYHDIGQCACPKPQLPEPEKPPQTWHLNVWTSVNGVIFTASAEATDEVTNGQALQEKMVGSVLWAVKEITAEYTPAKETE